MALIAVVNDDTAFLQLMEEALTDEGHRVCLHLIAAGVAEAIARERPDLVILDIVIELRDAGLRLLRALRGKRETADMPVIVCSADTAFLRAHAEELAALRCAVIAKPFDLGAMYATVAPVVELRGEGVPCGARQGRRHDGRRALGMIRVHGRPPRRGARAPTKSSSASSVASPASPSSAR